MRTKRAYGMTKMMRTNRTYLLQPSHEAEVFHKMHQPSLAAGAFPKCWMNS